MLEAYRGVQFQPWLRGNVDGIPPREFRALFSRRDALRRGMLRHVFLHASLENRYADRAGEVRDDLREAGFDRRLVEANVAQMTALVTRLRPRDGESTWRDYRWTCTYDDHDASQKDDFVRRTSARQRRRMIWDLGCNDGRYSRIASEDADVVLAIDSDRAVVDELYRELRHDDDRRIIPLVIDLTNPSPAIGWSNSERKTLLERGTPDLGRGRARVPHPAISGGLPLREVVRWLRSLGCEIVVEFPDRADSQVQRLLAGKRAGAHPDYSRENFEALLASRFTVVESLELTSGTRTLYHAQPA
jgi:hypothetical protein